MPTAASPGLAGAGAPAGLVAVAGTTRPPASVELALSQLVRCMGFQSVSGLALFLPAELVSSLPPSRTN